MAGNDPNEGLPGDAINAPCEEPIHPEVDNQPLEGDDAVGEPGPPAMIIVSVLI